MTYVATNVREGLLPSSWYVKHVLEGAKAAGFPDFYVEKLENVEAQLESDFEREKRELSIYN